MKIMLCFLLLFSTAVHAEDIINSDTSENRFAQSKPLNSQSQMVINEHVNLPKIKLTNNPWTMNSYNSNGGFQSTTFNRHYFTIDGLAEDIRVNFLATNLAPYLKPIPEAYSTIKTYQTCRVLTPILLVGGIVTGITLLVSNPGDSSGPNFSGLFVGVGIAFSSWIPHLVSKGKVDKSVEIYNRTRKK